MLKSSSTDPSRRRYLTYAKHATSFEAVSLVRKSMFALVAVLLSQNRREQLALALILVTLLIVSSALMRPWLQQPEEREGATLQGAEQAASDARTDSRQASSVSLTNPLESRSTLVPLEVDDNLSQVEPQRKWTQGRLCRAVGVVRQLPSRVSTTALELTGFITVMMSLAAIPIVEQGSAEGATSISVRGATEVAVIVVNVTYGVVSTVVLAVDFVAYAVRKRRSLARKAKKALAFLRKRCCCKKGRGGTSSADVNVE